MVTGGAIDSVEAAGIDVSHLCVCVVPASPIDHCCLRSVILSRYAACPGSLDQIVQFAND